TPTGFVVSVGIFLKSYGQVFVGTTPACGSGGSRRVACAASRPRGVGRPPGEGGGPAIRARDGTAYSCAGGVLVCAAGGGVGARALSRRTIRCCDRRQGCAR